MVNKSPRELFQIPVTWSGTQIMASLEQALDGSGPALAFGPTKYNSVASDIAVVIPTSGSTGAPKEVALSSSALRASAQAAHRFLNASVGDTWSLLLPTNHIAGINVLVRALDLGSSLVESNYQFTAIVPTQLYRALHGDAELRSALQSAKAVLVGGAATDDQLLDQATAAGINVVTTYGMSEMSGGCVYNNEPLAGVDVDVREDGRIALRGSMQATSYLGVDEPFADSEGWFLTNDAGYMKDGKLFVTGRIDDQIISGGEKISLAAIDAFLNANFENEFISCAIPNPEWGQSLCIAATGTFNREEVKSALREEFGRHAVPKYFLESAQLPRTSLQKPDRQTLAKRFEMMYP